MIRIPQDKVAVIPIFDSEETRGGIVKATSFNYKRDKEMYEIVDEKGKKLDEAEDRDRARYLVTKYRHKGRMCAYRKIRVKEEDQPLEAGERCDQGVVKYIGPKVKDIKIGDYVFFSGYTGSLVHIEGEGRLIIMPESFIICTFDIDNFTRIPGLYFKSRDNKYFEATFEEAMNIIADSFTLLNKTVDITSEKPKLEDYNVR